MAEARTRSGSVELAAADLAAIQQEHAGVLDLLSCVEKEAQEELAMLQGALAAARGA